jgi:hypothetical protein
MVKINFLWGGAQVCVLTTILLTLFKCVANQLEIPLGMFIIVAPSQNTRKKRPI